MTGNVQRKIRIALLTGLALGLVTLAIVFSRKQERDPRDLSYWMREATAKQWTSEPSRGEPRSQFLFGLTLIHTNFVTMIDRAPGLSKIPLFGKRFFENVSYHIDGNISQEQLSEAYRWIKQSADQGFAPAQEAKKLFKGRLEGM